jgi:hypothetical protein
MTAVLPSLADRLQLADGDHRSGLVTSGEDPAALRSVTRMELQLTYDMLGTRLRAIGGVEVTYRRWEAYRAPLDSGTSNTTTSATDSALSAAS